MTRQEIEQVEALLNCALNDDLNRYSRSKQSIRNGMYVPEMLLV